MVLQIVFDMGERWEALNTTTQETILIEKSVLQHAIKLAKAEVISEFNDKT